MSEPGRTRVVHCRKEPFDIYIGRSMPRYPELRATGWGNPFRPARGTNGERDAAGAVQRYRAWVIGQPQLLARLPELRGKTPRLLVRAARRALWRSERPHLSWRDSGRVGGWPDG